MDVFEIFSEFSIPLLREVTFAKSLSVETSLRLAQYSVDSLDNVASYKLGFMWIPVEGYGIRANYSRSQRAPSISDLYSPPRGDFDNFDDICEGVTATSTEVGHANCRLDPTLATLISEDEAFELADENNSYSPNAGNSNVNVETSDSYTFGITMAPDFLIGFNLAIDYYDISIEDALGEIPNEEILEQCYNSSLSYGTDNAFCNDITRNSEGQITKIIQRVYNLNEESARGVDITFSQKIDLNDYGSLTLKGDFNHVIEQSTTYEGNDGLETLNYAGYYTSQDKGSVSLRWKLDELSVRWKVKYLGDSKMS
ncbi:TonB-dependent receptor [Pseudoalteromonas sp. B62]